MKAVGIDLSMRSTGLVAMNSDGSFVSKLVTPDAKKYKDEDVLEYNAEAIIAFLKENTPDVIAIEDLSYNSVSSSKDLIAGNFWFLRCAIKREFPNVPVKIVPVLSWRNPLFVKAERDQHRADTKALKEVKASLMKVGKEEKIRILGENESLILSSNIKYLTFKKLPESVQNLFEPLGFTKGCFDLTDAYFIAKHVLEK